MSRVLKQPPWSRRVSIGPRPFNVVNNSWIWNDVSKNWNASAIAANVDLEAGRHGVFPRLKRITRYSRQAKPTPYKVLIVGM